jgi:hypothetical protein
MSLSEGDKMTQTTKQLTTSYSTHKHLAEYVTDHYTVNIISDCPQQPSVFTITFESAEKALLAIEKAKAQAFKTYLEGGGNPRNKRSFGSSFASVKKAIIGLEVE